MDTLTFRHAMIAGAISIAALKAGIGTAAVPSEERPSATLSAERCGSLAGSDISEEVGTPVQITFAKADAERCVLEGYANPQIQFRLVLPAHDWNGKFLEVGNGGMAGSLPANYSAAGSGDPVALGYAVLVTDGGHTSTPFDAKWADHNLAGLIDYSFRAVHVGGLVGKALIRHAYGRPARLAYFAGCSDGGREALKLAQNFPTDFDGIIAGAPSMRMANIYLNLYWMGQHVGAGREGGSLRPEALTLLHTAAIDQCTHVSGISHGNLLHPERCIVSVDPLACKPGASLSACLSAQEVADAKAAYGGPTRRDGSPVAPPSALPGSELQWGIMAFPPIARYPLDVYRHIAFGDYSSPGWRGDGPDLEAYPAAMTPVEALWSATNPDLRDFRKHGGKLLSYMGWNDPVGGVLDTVDYYRTTRQTMGGRDATSGFYRLFMIPGMGHCSGGTGPYQIDYLSYLNTWVEKDRPPASVHGAHPAADGQAEFEEDITSFE